jgi:hypothetical protein
VLVGPGNTGPYWFEYELPTKTVMSPSAGGESSKRVRMCEVDIPSSGTARNSRPGRVVMLGIQKVK